MRIRHFTHPQILYDLIRLFQIKGKKAKQKDGKLSIRAQMVRRNRAITTFTLLRHFAGIALANSREPTANSYQPNY